MCISYIRAFGAAAAALLGLLTGVACASSLSAAPALRPIIVLNSLDANISVIDPVSFAEIRRVPTGKEPHHLYLAPNEKSLLVANALSDSFTLIDPATGNIQRTITGVSDPYHLRFSPDMRYLVTAANRLNHISIYRWQPTNEAEPVKLLGRVNAPRTPSHLAINSMSTVVYSSLQDSDELIAIELATQKVLWKSSTGRMPADIFLTANNRYLFVALTGGKEVEVYEISLPAPALIKRIPTGEGAHAFRALGDNRHVLVSNRAGNTISRIDTRTMAVVESYPAPGGPDCMEVLADGKTLLVTSRWARKLTMIDMEKKQVIREVPVGRSPHGVWTLDHAARQ